MKRFTFVIATVGMIFGLAATTPCHAVSHAYVSVNGDDNNATCSISEPCATIAGALVRTDFGGEISCLDGGTGRLNGNGQFISGVTVQKSVTIDCAGVPFAALNVVINGSGIVVTLRNLTLTTWEYTYLSGSYNGIEFMNGAALFLENCVIEHFDQSGGNTAIHFAPTSGTAKLYVTDSVIKNNGTASDGGGIIIQPAAGAEADVVIERTKVENNRVGIVAVSQGTVHGVVRDSVVAGSVASWGIGAAGSGVSLLVENTTVTGNNIGLVAETKAGMLVSHSSIVLNTNGLYAAGGGSLLSYKNNNLNRNIHSDGAFTTTLAQQ
jgi:hypothetical protein